MLGEKNRFFNMTNKQGDFQKILERLDSMNFLLLKCQDDIKLCNTNITQCNESLQTTVLPRLTNLEADVKQMKREIQQLKDRQNDLDCYIRRENLIFGGISESYPENCEVKVKYVLQEKLGLETDDMKFQRVHRHGKKEDGKTRPIIVRFLWHVDRQKVWKLRSKLRGTPYWVSEDYPKEIEDNRRILRPILRQALSEADDNYSVSAYLVGDRLHIEGQVYTVHTLGKLPKELRPERVATPRIGDNLVAFFNKTSPLSNFHPAKFEIEGRQFAHVEQFFQFKRAEICGKADLANEIANEQSPYRCKELGKKAKFNNAWRKRNEDVMLAGCMAKFEQNPELLEFLKDTGTRTIVEARIDDKFWGAGLRADDEKLTTTEPNSWPGKNNLGKILTQVRERLQTTN